MVNPEAGRISHRLLPTEAPPRRGDGMSAIVDVACGLHIQGRSGYICASMESGGPK